MGDWFRDIRDFNKIVKKVGEITMDDKENNNLRRGEKEMLMPEVTFRVDKFPDEVEVIPPHKQVRWITRKEDYQGSRTRTTLQVLKLSPNGNETWVDVPIVIEKP